MRIVIKNLEDSIIDIINTDVTTLTLDIKRIKAKYPPGKYHAELETY